MRGQPQARERTQVPSEQEAVCAPDPVKTLDSTLKCLSPAGIQTAGRPSRGFATLLNTLGHAVAQLVEALRYKSEGRGFDSRWCHWNFSLT